MVNVRKGYMRLWLIFLLTLQLTAAPVPNQPLVNHSGKPFQLYDLKGAPVIVAFIYTRCPLPKMCPLTMALLKQFYSLTKRDNPGKFKILVATLDPKNDTPKRMHAYGKQQGVLAEPSPFIFATGNERVLSDFASEFNVMSFPSEGEVSHNVKLIVLDSKMEVAKEYKDNEWTPKQLLEDIRKLSTSKS